MELAVISQAGDAGSDKVQVADSAFGADFNEPLVHQVITAYMAGARAGTKGQKSRAQVRGGGAKPWRQKGTGRARVGSIRSPLWRSGGVTFAASSRSYDQKVNRKMYRAAMRSILSELLRQERLVVVDGFQLEETKTKAAVAKLYGLGMRDVLIVLEEPDEQLELAVRNLHWAAAVGERELNPVSLLAFDKVLITAPALKALEERLG